jgi:omega-hydroxy-beta-dihydromenaquinone-9 sulfotransferase
MANRKTLGKPLPLIQGMTFSALQQAVARNGLNIPAPLLGRLFYLGAIGVLNSVLGRCEEVAYGRRIVNTRIEAPPLFVLGHWRSGTTHLHYLLSQDENFACPTAYQSMFPGHFILSQQVGGHIFNLIAPHYRLADNMTFAAHVPQEDEFALAALSTVSPYMRFLFPDTGDGDYSALDLGQLPKGALRKWEQAFLYFLKKLTYMTGKRIVLKSPPHLGRVGTVLGLLPGSQFLHIVRDPYAVYASTKKLWQVILSYTHLQKVDAAELDEIILASHTELFSLFERQRQLIPSGSLHEVKLEDLEREPLNTLEQIYDSLGLMDFDLFRKRVIPYLESIKGYRKQDYTLDEASLRQVRKRWAGVFERYDYPT